MSVGEEVISQIGANCTLHQVHSHKAPKAASEVRGSGRSSEESRRLRRKREEEEEEEEGGRRKGGRGKKRRKRKGKEGRG